MRSSRILFAGGMLALLGLALYLRPGAEEAPAQGASPETPAAPAQQSTSRDGRVAGQRDERTILYDEARPVPRAPFGLGARAYDAALASVPGGGTWVAWLELVPGAGDRLHCARLGDGGLEDPLTLEPAPAPRAAPSLAAGTDGSLWLGEEERTPEGGWDVFLRRRGADGRFGPRLRVSEDAGVDACHALALEPAPSAAAWVVWQADVDGEFAILARRVAPAPPDGAGGAAGALRGEAVQRLSPPGWGSWDPAVGVDQAGRVFVAWDAFPGESFDVLARVLEAGTWSETHAVAVGPELQARAELAGDPGGRMWILWEEGEPRWGATFASRKEEQPGGGDPTLNNLRDDAGPLHRYRALRVAVLLPDGRRALPAAPLPLPSIEAGRARPRRTGALFLGSYYERGRLCIDGAGRPWVLYRHGYVPRLGNQRLLPHHVFAEGFRVYARCLQGEAWSELLRLELPQRDGLQRLEASPLADGCQVAWAVGRSDRLHGAPGMPPGDGRDPPPGVAFARLTLAPARAPAAPALLAPEAVALPGPAPVPPAHAPALVGGTSYALSFGDLHRHTDLSLCNSFLDGTLDDAYRYAIEVARLGFLAVTDHTFDLDVGEADGLAWWRSTKEVGRRALAGRFVPFVGFERSGPDTDHNFITLREELLFHHPPYGAEDPLPEVWRGLDRDTFTVPHYPFRGRVWEYQDDLKRPLLEIQQGFRSVTSEAAAHAGLGRGYRFGFIASSDHLSTSASYAGVWSPGPGREALFRSLQARRTFAASVPLRLVVHAGERWMGERLSGAPGGELTVEVDGSAPLARVEVVLDGRPAAALPLEPGSPRFRGRWPIPPPPVPPGDRESWAYVHVLQADGGEAWSSPLWFAGR